MKRAWDSIPPAIRLGCLWRLDELLGALADLVEALKAKSVEFDDVVKSGRTHLQDAVPVRLGQEFAAYAEALKKSRLSLLQAEKSLLELGIGGSAAGTWCTRPADR